MVVDFPLSCLIARRTARMHRMTSSLLDSPRAQRGFMIGLLLLFVGLSIQYSVKVMTPKRDGHTASAVLRWAEQIKMMEDGENVHRSHNYPNPPIMALILRPFAGLADISPLAGALTWFYLKVAMALLAMLWVFRMVESPDHPFPAWAKTLTVLLSVRPIMSDLTHGNVNIFILFLVIGSLYAFSRGRDFLAGVLLALAIACKVTPALFVGYFLWKGAWRVLAGCAVGMVLFFVGIPALWLGWEQNLVALTSWVQVMIVPYVLGGVVTPEHNNQSLPGLVARLLTEAPSFSTYIGSHYIPLRYQNLADIGAEGAKWLVKGAMGLFVLLVLWRCRAPIAAAGRSKAEVRTGWPLAAEYALILVGMLIFSERTWKHHCVTLLLPFAVICYTLATMPISLGQRRFLWSAIALATLLIASTSTGVFGSDPPKVHEIVEQTSILVGAGPVLAHTLEGALTDSFPKQAQTYGAYLWAFGLLVGSLVVVLRRRLDRAALPLPAPAPVEVPSQRRAA
jgi:alpha-1,2-mannosyltransferase